tara:strand:- start:1627 stop:3480 length:1854 start_codon:yes stop_codon:yes gene_type:complete
MCGVLGAVSNKIDKSLFDKSLESLSHRGPDDRNSKIINFLGTNFFLGHTRLSIIDLSQNGSQPMSSDEDDFEIIFNGEIYNYEELRLRLEQNGHTFNSNSDTEVLLKSWKEWGQESLNKFVGMFAFCIFDKKRQMFFLARDQFGIKPLYYLSNKNGFFFASEIKSLKFFDDLQPNDRACKEFLINGSHDASKETFFKNIYKVQPGEVLKYNLFDNTFSSDFWVKISEKNKKFDSFESAKKNVQEEFMKNMKLHLRSDVDVSSSLSGGIDSSSIVSMMKYINKDKNFNTFSYISAGDKSEEKWIDLVNENTNAISNKIFVSEQNIVEEIEKIIEIQEEPFGSTSIYAQYKVFEEASKNNVKVLLDGQGADECLCGYEGYPEYYFEDLIFRFKFIKALKFLKFWRKKFDKKLIDQIRVVLVSILHILKIKDLLKSLFFKNPDWIIGNKVFLNLARKNNSFSYIGKSSLSSKLYDELFQERLQRLLRYQDKNSMHFSIESRVPFLTQEFVELLINLPNEYLMNTEATTKYIFRESMKGIVHEDIMERKDKIGFETPETKWMPELWQKVKKEYLSEVNAPWLDKEKLVKSVEDSLNKAEINPQIWWIINFFIWSKLNKFYI